MATTVYPGVYRARIVSDDGLMMSANIPQVFGETAVTITDYTGYRPLPGDWGYVAFEGGDSSFPVWLSFMG